VSRSGEKLLTHSSALLCGLLLLALVTVVNAAPTVTPISGSTVTSPAPDDGDTHVTLAETPHFTDYGNSTLSELAENFLAPPDDSTASIPNGAKSLPAVPAALLMVLTGFACVSLVRDRRLWIAALAGLLWAGQAGVQNLPKLAQRFAHTNHNVRQDCSKLDRSRQLETFARCRADIEGTRYVALLHYLAGIPNGSTVSLFENTSRKNLDISGPVQYALTHLPVFAARPIRALAAEAAQFTCFSPAFIFQNLARYYFS